MFLVHTVEGGYQISPQIPKTEYPIRLPPTIIPHSNIDNSTRLPNIPTYSERKLIYILQFS